MLNDIPRSELTLPGGIMTYRSAGKGEPLLFLHGLGGSSMSWVSQLETLSHEYRVIAWDAPGYGGSARRPPDAGAHAAAAAELIDALGFAPVTLIGHSMGGIVAARLAAERPELLSMVVLSSTLVGRGASADEPLASGFQARIRELTTLDRKDFGLARARAMAAEQASPQTVQILADIAAEVSPDGFIDACRMLNCANNEAALQKLALPVLILEAAQDRIVTREDGNRLAELIPHAERHVQPGVGHAPYLENPQHYNKAVTDFVRSNSGGR